MMGHPPHGHVMKLITCLISAGDLHNYQPSVILTFQWIAHYYYKQLTFFRLTAELEKSFFPKFQGPL